MHSSQPSPGHRHLVQHRSDWPRLLLQRSDTTLERGCWCGGSADASTWTACTSSQPTTVLEPLHASGEGGNTLSRTCCLLGWRTTDSPCRTSCVARALSLCAATLATLAWQGWRSNIRDGPRGHMLHERLRSHETTGLAFRAVRATQPQAAKAYRLLLLPSPLGVGLATYSRHQSGRDNAPGADTTAL